MKNFDPENIKVVLKDTTWLARQKRAGEVHAKGMRLFNDLIENWSENQNLNLLEIESQVSSIIDEENCTPTFYQYKGFPGKVCLSVNETLVHGIPHDYVLKNGDVITLDYGVTFEGAIADGAITKVVGESKDPKIEEMLSTCIRCLKAGIEAIEVEKQLGVIGNAIAKEAAKSPFGLVTTYGGHGINYDTPHAPPFVSNSARRDEGIRIQPGLSIAIEPMLVSSRTVKTKTLKDKWTIITKSIGCHFEHSVTLDQDGNVIIITDHGLF